MRSYVLNPSFIDFPLKKNFFYGKLHYPKVNILTFWRFVTCSWVSMFICSALAKWPAAKNKHKTVTTSLPMPTPMPVPEKMTFIMTSIIAFTTKALKFFTLY